MSRGVAISTDHSHTGQGETFLGADDVHNSLTRVTHRVQLNSELLTVRPQNFNLLLADRIGDWKMNIFSGNVVILGSHREVCSAHTATAHS